MKASGPHGTLLKGDVLSAIKSGKISPKSASKEKAPSSQSHQQVAASQDSKSLPKQSDAFEDFPNSQIRKVDSLNSVKNGCVVFFEFLLLFFHIYMCVCRY